MDDREEQADAQGDLRAEMTNLVKQLAVLRPSLNPEQKDRLDQADAFGRGGQLVAQMEIARQRSSTATYRAAADGQLKTSQDLQALAAALRGPRDKVAALREARDRVEKLLQAEQEFKKDTRAAAGLRQPARAVRPRPAPTRCRTTPTSSPTGRRGWSSTPATSARRVDELAKEVAAKLTPAESEMRRAQDELRRRRPARGPSSRRRTPPTGSGRPGTSWTS